MKAKHFTYSKYILNTESVSVWAGTGPEEFVFSKSSLKRSWDLGQSSPILVGIPMCNWAGWERDLMHLCLWKKMWNSAKSSFGLGCVCSLHGLAFNRVNFTEAAEMVVRSWVFSFWIYPSSVTNYLQCWTHYVLFLRGRGPICDRRLHQETVFQT